MPVLVASGLPLKLTQLPSASAVSTDMLEVSSEHENNNDKSENPAAFIKRNFIGFFLF
jgi:hypothetical protein